MTCSRDFTVQKEKLVPERKRELLDQVMPEEQEGGLYGASLLETCIINNRIAIDGVSPNYMVKKERV